MAKGITLPIVFKSDTKGLKDAQIAVSGFEKQVSVVNKLLKTGMVAAAAAATAAVGGLSFVLTKGFERLQDIDNAEFKLRGLGHTAESVEQIMSDALSAVKGTAFGMGEAASIAASAVAAGVKPGQELAKYLSLTADAAAIAGVPLNEMGAILNKVTTANRAYTMELTQLADRGIPIFQALAEVAGVSAAEVRDLASEGKIDAAMLAEALENTLGGAALRMGESLAGAFANTGAALSRVGANLLKDVFPRFGEFFNALIEAMEPVEEMAAQAGQAIGDKLNPVFDRLIGVLPQLSTFLGTLGSTLENIRSRAGDVMSFFSPLIDAFGRGLALLPQLTPVVEQLSDFFGKLATEGLGLLVTFGSKLIDSVLPLLIDTFTRLAPPVIAIANNLIDLFVPIIEVLANIALPVLVAILQIVSPILTALATIVSNTTAPIVIMVGVVYGAIKAFALFKGLMLLVQAVQIGVAAATYGVAGATYAQTAASKLAFIATNLLNGTYLLQAGALVTNTVHMIASRVALIATTVATNAAAAAQWLLNAAMTANPFGLILAALAAVTVALIWFFTSTDAGRAIIANVFEFFRITFEAFALGFTTIFTKTLPAAGESFMSFLGTVGEFFVDFGQGFWKVLTAVGGFFKDAINGYLDLWEGFLNFFINGLNTLISGLNKLSVKLPATALTPAVNFGVNIPKIPNVSIPRLAEGGIVTSPTLAMIGEGGESEAVIPLSKLGKTGSTYNITVNAGLGSDGNRIGEEIVRQITRFERLSGPVFARA
jgi:tape measure domain-containing protein